MLRKSHVFRRLCTELTYYYNKYIITHNILYTRNTHYASLNSYTLLTLCTVYVQYIELSVQKLDITYHMQSTK